MLIELATVITITIAMTIFDFIHERIGNNKARNEVDPNYKPTEADLQMIEKSKEVILKYFPDGIENTMLALSVGARIEKIKELTLEISEKYNIDISFLTFYNTEQLKERDHSETTAGYYDMDEKGIALNVDMITLNNGERLKDVIDTIIHECRHAFQHKAIESPERYGVDTKTALEWSNNFAYYIPPEIDLREYYYQPIEFDARNFAALTLTNL